LEDYILVDIGNTHFHVLDKKIYSTKEIKSFKKRVFYISVNKEKEKLLLQKNPDAINLEPFIKIDTNYQGLGVDRKCAILAIDDGVVVDAGSAVTIDVVKNGKHLGGLIMPGIYSFKKAFCEISQVLDKDFTSLKKYPQNTSEAITAGSIGAIVCMIKSLGGESRVYLTGGDAELLSKYIDGEVVKNLVFEGMKKVIFNLKF